MNPETSILKRVQVAASELGVRLFRNNNGTLQDRFGSYVTYGLCPGSPDLVGWTPVKITQEMVGQTVAVFTGVEIKTATGVVEEAQKNFLGVVAQAGGIAFVARAKEDAVKILRRHLGS